MVRLRAPLTVIWEVALNRESAVDVARTVAVPTLIPVKTPVALTVATAAFSEVQTTVVARPASASTVAVNGWTSPTRIGTALGVTTTPRTPSTWTEIAAVSAPAVASTDVVPVARAVIVAVFPVLLTVATVTLLLLQVTAPASEAPSASSTVAVTVCVAPMADSATVDVDRVRLAGGLGPSPPHPVSPTRTSVLQANSARM